MADKIATESEARSIGEQGTAINNKMCTKSRALELGCNVNGDYTYNQLVCLKDLTKLIIDTYFLTIDVIYKPFDFYNSSHQALSFFITPKYLSEYSGNNILQALNSSLEVWDYNRGQYLYPVQYLNKDLTSTNLTFEDGLIYVDQSKYSDERNLSGVSNKYYFYILGYFGNFGDIPGVLTHEHLVEKLYYGQVTVYKDSYIHQFTTSSNYRDNLQNGSITISSKTYMKYINELLYVIGVPYQKLSNCPNQEYGLTSAGPPGVAYGHFNYIGNHFNEQSERITIPLDLYSLKLYDSVVYSRFYFWNDQIQVQEYIPYTNNIQTYYVNAYDIDIDFYDSYFQCTDRCHLCKGNQDGYNNGLKCIDSSEHYYAYLGNSDLLVPRSKGFKYINNIFVSLVASSTKYKKDFSPVNKFFRTSPAGVNNEVGIIDITKDRITDDCTSRRYRYTAKWALSNSSQCPPDNQFTNPSNITLGDYDDISKNTYIHVKLFAELI